MVVFQAFVEFNKIGLISRRSMKARYYSTSELAEKTGTSRQVISAIINNNWKQKRISEGTFLRIKKAMDEIGFVPDRTAISLRKEKRNTVGLLCHGPLYSHTLTALEKLNHYFLESEKSVEMHISSEGGLTQAIRELMGQRVESIIILLSPMLENFGVQDLKNENLHKLLRVVPHIIYNFPFDVHDEEMEAKFLSLGSHLIGFSRSDAYLPFLEYLKAQNMKKILIDEKIFALFRPKSKASELCAWFEKIYQYPNPQSGKLTENPFLLGEKLASDLLPLIKKEKFDYVITFSDGIAQGMAKRLIEFGHNVPKDIQVIGFDHIDSLEYLKHVISTIEVPIAQMMTNLINILEAIPTKNQSLRSHTKLHLK